jgi:signal transduction histidine kinase
VIAREIVAAHGGALSLVESGAGGTTFRIELPLRQGI